MQLLGKRSFFMERRGYFYQPDLAEEGKLVYNVSFDERDYAGFQSLSIARKERLKAYTLRQIETYVGERVNVEESVTRYEIVDGRIFSAEHDAFLTDIIKKGIAHRRKFGNPIDFAREDAELVGAEKTEARLCDPETPIGAMNLSISPPSGDYKNNFFDAWVVKQDEKGRRYLEAHRYLSDLTIDEYRSRVAPFKQFESRPTPVEFLEDPIEMDGFESPEEVQKYFSGGVRVLEKEELKKIHRINLPLYLSYMNSLIDNPYDFFTHRLRYNAFLNNTDIVANAVRDNDTRLLHDLRLALAFAPQELVEEKIWSLGMRQVREDMKGPCPGKSGGYTLPGMENSLQQSSSPFSVTEFGMTAEQAKEDPNLCQCNEGKGAHFHCPSCGYPIIVGEGITNCPSCEEGKKC
jgi:hypothetical protein